MTKKISKLHGTKQGKKCALVGHGISIKDGFILPTGLDVIGVNCRQDNRPVKIDYFLYYDNIIVDWVNENIGPKTMIIAGENTLKEGQVSRVDYEYNMKEYPPRHTGMPAYRSGLKALYLAVRMGYEKIFLYGYDFIPMEPGENKALDQWLEQFSDFLWPEGRIVQTNPDSKLQFKEHNYG